MSVDRGERAVEEADASDVDELFATNLFGGAFCMLLGVFCVAGAAARA